MSYLMLVILRELNNTQPMKKKHVMNSKMSNVLKHGSCLTDDLFKEQRWEYFMHFQSWNAVFLLRYNTGYAKKICIVLLLD